MAHAGASGHTQATLEAVFGFPRGPDMHEAMNALLRALAAAESDDVVLAVANSGWTQAGRPIGQPYRDTLATHYGGPSRVIRGLSQVHWPPGPQTVRLAVNGSGPRFRPHRRGPIRLMTVPRPPSRGTATR